MHVALTQEPEVAASPVEVISSDGRSLCLVVRHQIQTDSTTFVTPPEFNLQIGFVVHPAGHVIRRHTHVPIQRHITGTSEVLIVRKGKCVLDVYNDARECVASRELEKGDVMVMVGGGHGFRMLEDTVLIEVKQGPYPGVAEKEWF
jgi:uncharacterized protein with PhoU and TrkA domain